MSHESRLHPRLRLNVYADVIGREVLLYQELADISLGGCRFSGPAWEAEGTSLQLVLSFPGSNANVPVSALVVRATESDMGVRFDEITDDQKWALRKHIREAQVH